MSAAPEFRQQLLTNKQKRLALDSRNTEDVMRQELSLSSCPFCGAAPQVCRSKGYAFVQCGKCYAEGPVAREDADHAAAAWNRRTQQAAVSTASQPGTERSGVDQAILPQTEKGS
jgi:Lar family restriction alleviation protein